MSGQLGASREQIRARGERASAHDLDPVMTPVPGGSSDVPVIKIVSHRSWRIDWQELYEYRDLLYFLVYRDVRAKYKQTVMGLGWALIQPVVSMIVFTVIFGGVAKISSDGLPYSIFSYAALVPWTYFQGALEGSTSSLITQSALLTKVYFPRLIIPLGVIFGQLVNFGIAMMLLFVMMVYYGIAPTPWVAFLPVLILMMMMTAGGAGFLLTAMAIQYRDVKYGITLLSNVLMYAAPVVYPVSLIPEQYRLLYALNPMVGVIEGFRAALLGSVPMPWDLILVGGVMSVCVAFAGALYFKSVEGVFADVA